MMNTRGFGVLRALSTTGSTSSSTSRRLFAGALAATLVSTGVTLTAAPAATALPTPTTVVSTATTASAADIYERRVQRLVNVRRENHNLRRLRFASCPDQVAEEWSSTLAATNDFYHRSMTDVLNICDATYAGETLGRGSMSPRKLVQMWMDSPPHRAVLLSSKSRRFGVGATLDSSGRWVVAANFVRF